MRNELLSQTIGMKYAQFCKAKCRTIKGLNIAMTAGPIYHPAYLERAAKRTNSYCLDDLLRGCLYAPAHVANGYWDILNEHYRQIKPKPNYKQLSAMLYGILWSGTAYELCRFSGYTPPLSADWHDFRRADLDHFYGCSSFLTLNFWKVWGLFSEFKLLQNEAFTKAEQRVLRRYALAPLSSQIDGLSVQYIDEQMSGVLGSLRCHRLQPYSRPKMMRSCYKTNRGMAHAHRLMVPRLNADLVRTLTAKYAQFCKAKNMTLKQMGVQVPSGRILHPAYLKREAERTDSYQLDEMLRGCMLAPLDVASGYWEILDLHYSNIKPEPTCKQFMAMFYGVMWSGFASELLEYSGIIPPLPFGWRNYHRKDMDFDEFDANYELEPWSLFLDIKRIIMCRIDTLTPMQQRLYQRVLLDMVLYQVVELDVPNLSEYVSVLLEHMDLFDNLVTPIDIEHMPAKWYKSQKHLAVVEQTRAILAKYEQYAQAEEYSGTDSAPE